jgi:hypothetical protein
LTLHLVDDSITERIKALLPLQVKEFEENMKYLGYQLKDNNYSYKDWLTVYKKIEKKIIFWCNRWISIWVRLTLLKNMVKATHVWMSLAYIPRGIVTNVW